MGIGLRRFPFLVNLFMIMMLHPSVRFIVFCVGITGCWLFAVNSKLGRSWRSAQILEASGYGYDNEFVQDIANTFSEQPNKDKTPWLFDIYHISGDPERLPDIPSSGYNSFEARNYQNRQPLDLSKLAVQFKGKELVLMLVQAQDYTFLSKLKNLNSLNLSWSNIDSLEPLRGLTGLCDLQIDHTSVTSLEPILELKNINRLNAGSTPLENIDGIEKLRALQFLRLKCNNPTEDFSRIGYLQNLWQLEIESKELKDLSFLPNLSLLHSLILTNTSVQDWSAISKCTSLKMLYVTGGKNMSFGDLTQSQIEEISLIDCDLSSLDELAKLTKGRTIEIRGTGDLDLSIIVQIANQSSLRNFLLYGYQFVHEEELPNLQKQIWIKVSPTVSQSELKRLQKLSKKVHWSR